MQTIFHKIGEIILTVSLAVAGLFGFTAPENTPIENVGAIIPTSVAVFQSSLQSSITATATSMTLVSGTDKAGNNLSGYICFNIDEGTTTEEFVCGTTSGTAVTSMIRGIDPVDGDLEVTALKKTHRRGASVKITDYPTLGILSRIINGSETIPNAITYANGVTPTNAGDLTDKEYVLSVVSGGSVSFEKVVLAGTAGETISIGNLVYLKSSDGRWWKTDADTASTIENVKLGIAQGAGTAGGAITDGILISGRDTNQTGLSANTIYYASNSAGGISSSAGTKEVTIGIALSTTEIIFSPRYNQQITEDEQDALAGGGDLGTPSSLNKFVTADGIIGLVTNFGDGSDGDVVVSGTTNLSKDMYYDDLTVTGTLNTNNWRVFVKGTLSGNGTIANNGGNGGNSVGMTAGAAGAKISDGYFVTLPGYIGGAGKDVTAGGNAGTAGGASATSIGVAGVAGGAGGAGDAQGGGGGGAAGAVTATLQKFGINRWQTISAIDYALNGTPTKYNGSSGSGSGGGGGLDENGNTGTSGGGGGSGAPGGIMPLFINNFTGTATITANGGNGGNGGDGAVSAGPVEAGGGGGGSGGSGGHIYVIYKTKTWTGSYSVAGGTAGTGGTGVVGGGGGQNGANGNVGTTGTTTEININTLL